MKICYVVYREDNVMVFDSQVLDYLKLLNTNEAIESCELILFMHQSNLRRKEEVKNKILRYIESLKVFDTYAPPLSIMQLNLNSVRLEKYIKGKYKREEKIGVICRGDFATYVSAKAFKDFPNSRILFDNRGLPYEESQFAHPKGTIHYINRQIKRKSILFSKDHCDGFNFVTNKMREFLLETYKYSPSLPFTIIPTMYSPDDIDPLRMKEIEKLENYSDDQFVISYMGSTAASQEIDRLIDVIKKSSILSEKIRYFILSNGEIPELNNLPENTQKRITKKHVPHSDIKYYLKMTDVGVVIRESIIINQVAAPTKITEYIAGGLHVLYNGDIGLLQDIKRLVPDDQFISIDGKDLWTETVKSLVEKKVPKSSDLAILEYFDMKIRQKETIQLLKKCLQNKKVR